MLPLNDDVVSLSDLSYDEGNHGTNKIQSSRTCDGNHVVLWTWRFGKKEWKIHNNSCTQSHGKLRMLLLSHRNILCVLPTRCLLWDIRIPKRLSSDSSHVYKYLPLRHFYCQSLDQGWANFFDRGLHSRSLGPWRAAQCVLGSLADRTVCPWVFGGPHLFDSSENTGLIYVLLQWL